MKTHEHHLSERELAPVRASASAETPASILTAGGDRRLSGAIILGVPILLVLITFLFWYQTWFGRRLTDSELGEYLQNTSVPHKTQHALTQVAAEILRHEPGAQRVYPQVIALGGNNEAGLRSMAAWVMGQDNNSAEFHNALLKLIEDSDPMVGWNAALALARFGDAAGEPQLEAMLCPYDLRSPQAGTLTFRVNPHDAVRNGSVVARVKVQGSSEVEIRSPLAGRVERQVAKDGSGVAAGEEIAVITPDEQQIWQALRALYFVGQPEALADVERFMRPGAGASERVREQAGLTAEAIRKRQTNSVAIGK